jgi:uncharacterized linocin/CFP29 family protein
MGDFLMRDDAPLTDEEWERLDELVVEAAKFHLAGRRFIDLAGPFGFGKKVIEVYGYDEAEDGTTKVAEQKFLPLSLISRDFFLNWRDIEAAHLEGGPPLDLGAAVVVSVECAREEDEIVLGGLANAEGRNKSPLGNWDEEGSPFEAVTAACGVLAGAGFYGPYNLVVGLALYAKMQRVVKGFGRMLELNLVGEVLRGGSVLQSPVLDDKKAVLVCRGVHNLDIVVGQDLITAYLGPEEMEHRFRVMETLALRVKRPGAICTLE